MFYVKNLPVWERALRIVMGLMGIGLAVMNWNASGLMVVLGLMGAMLAVTGLIGFCPMCALVGREARKGH